VFKLRLSTSLLLLLTAYSIVFTGLTIQLKIDRNRLIAENSYLKSKTEEFQLIEKIGKLPRNVHIDTGGKQAVVLIFEYPPCGSCRVDFTDQDLLNLFKNASIKVVRYTIPENKSIYNSLLSMFNVDTSLTPLPVVIVSNGTSSFVFISKLEARLDRVAAAIEFVLGGQSEG